jgi:DNA-binding PadR family transcriptional regulator
MSIKHGLLALLRAEPKYGYQLRGEFEAATGATWPLNIGQVYTTLTRLERDGLVQPATDPAAGDIGDGRSMYEITDAGLAELTNWFETPVTRESRPRDELAIKLALALAVPGVNVAAVVQRQRAATMQSLQELTRLKRNSRDSDISCAAGAGVDDLRRRGRDPLARPLRGDAVPPSQSRGRYADS